MVLKWSPFFVQFYLSIQGYNSRFQSTEKWGLLKCLIYCWNKWSGLSLNVSRRKLSNPQISKLSVIKAKNLNVLYIKNPLPIFLQLDIVEFIPSLLYFGYTALMVLSFWLLTGTIGFYAAYMFIRKIYAAVKIDWVVTDAAALVFFVISFILPHPVF